MLVYESNEVTREDLEKLRKKNDCAVCGGWLNIFLDNDPASPNAGKAFIACAEWHRTHHEGIQREPSRYEMEGIAALNIPRRREILKREFGAKMETTLDKYRGGEQLTKEAAMTVLKLVYPDCPENQIIRTALLCRDFGLHPLMKEVYLIPFNKKGGGQDWATVIGITANRKIASAKKGAFSFLDDSPRAAIHAEIAKQFGDNSQEERENIISICKLQGERGNTATGFGLWPKSASPYGTDKGNTPRNMANIRAERQALDRLPGDAIPLKTVEVIDEAYAEVPKVGIVDKETGEIISKTGETGEAGAIEGEYREVATKPEHWCEEHQCEYEQKTRGTAVWYAHKKTDGKWCNELKKKEGAPAVEQTAEAEQASKEAADIKAQADADADAAAAQKAAASVPTEPPAEIESQRADLFQWVLQNKPELKNEKTVREWLINVVKIEPGLIESSPQACYKPVVDVTGWSL